MKGNKVASPGRTAFAINAITTNFPAASGVPQPHKISWTKPNRSSYTMNIDASFFDDGSGSAATILQNHKGEALAGGS